MIWGRYICLMLRTKERHYTKSYLVRSSLQQIANSLKKPPGLYIYIYNLKIVVNNNASPDTQCIIYLYRIPTYTFPIRVNHSCRYHTLNVWVNKNTNTFLQSKTQTSQLIQGTVISWWFFTDQTMGFSTVWGFFFSNHQRSKSKLIMRQLGQMSWKKIVGGLQLYKLGQCNYILLLVDNQIIRPTE